MPAAKLLKKSAGAPSFPRFLRKGWDSAQLSLSLFRARNACGLVNWPTDVPCTVFSMKNIHVVM